MDQGALTLDAQSGLPALVVNLCEDEGIESVRLTTSRTDSTRGEEELLWRIEAAEPQRLTRPIVVGSTPPGFTETAALRSDLPNKMVLVAENDGGVAAEQGGYLELDELEPGVLLQHGEQVSRSDLTRKAYLNCSANMLEQLGLPAWVDEAALGILVAIPVGILGMALATTFRRRAPVT